MGIYRQRWKYKSFKTNPLDFYKTHVRFDASEHFSLIHDPRNEYNKLYTVERLNNIFGGKPIEYINLEIDEIKQVAIKMLKDNEPVFLVQMLASFPIQNLEFWTQLPMTIQLLLTLAWISPNCRD